jgi:hypothetical protein
MSTLQAEVLKCTELEVASIGQIRLRLFKNRGPLEGQRQARPYRTLFGLSAAGALRVGSPAAR